MAGAPFLDIARSAGKQACAFQGPAHRWCDLGRMGKELVCPPPFVADRLRPPPLHDALRSSRIPGPSQGCRNAIS